jgi:hypothetical protein
MFNKVKHLVIFLALTGMTFRVAGILKLECPVLLLSTAKLFTKVMQLFQFLDASWNCISWRTFSKYRQLKQFGGKTVLAGFRRKNEEMELILTRYFLKF